jgi:hypothetical protein
VYLEGISLKTNKLQEGNTSFCQYSLLGNGRLHLTPLIVSVELKKW